MSSFSVEQLAIKCHEARAAAQRFPVVHRLRAVICRNELLPARVYKLPKRRVCKAHAQNGQDVRVTVWC